jgi:hypothetical protein
MLDQSERLVSCFPIYRRGTERATSFAVVSIPEHNPFTPSLTLLMWTNAVTFKLVLRAHTLAAETGVNNLSCPPLPGSQARAR